MEKVMERLKCDVCGGIQRPPLKMCKDTHVVCFNCETHLVVRQGSQSTEYIDCKGTETELDGFNMFFKNSYDHCQHDCGYFGEILALGDHEKNCENIGQPTKCQIKPCQWQGHAKGLLHHVKTEHPNQLVTLSSFENEAFPIDLSDPTKLILQFSIGYYNNYLYWTHLQEIDGSIFVVVVKQGHFGPTIEPDQTLDAVSLFSTEEDDTIIKTKTLTLPDEVEKQEISTEFMKDKGKNISSLNGFTYLLKMGNSAELLLPQSVMKDLECTICKCSMRGEIRMCSKGYSFCLSCAEKTDKCPTCGDHILESRNYALEAMTQKLFQKCKHFDAGCVVTGTTEVVKLHSHDCAFRPTKCIISTCQWNGPLLELKDHCKNSHNNQFECLFLYTHSVPDTKTTLYLSLSTIGVDNFVFTRIFDNDYVFAIHHLTDKDTTDYYFDIKFFNPTLGSSVGFTQPCRASTMENIWKKEYTNDKNNICRIPKKLFNKTICDENAFQCIFNVYKKQ